MVADSAAIVRARNADRATDRKVSVSADNAPRAIVPKAIVPNLNAPILSRPSSPILATAPIRPTEWRFTRKPVSYISTSRTSDE